MPPMILEEIERIQERYHIVSSDPAVIPTRYAKGAVLVYVPTVGAPIVYKKNTDGLNTDVTPLGGGGPSSTAISGLYFVSANGTPGGVGSLSDPIDTPANAIAKAIADGHTNSNRCEILVLPKAATYPGFTGAPGINIRGFANASARTKIGASTFAPTTAVADDNQATYSNIHFIAGGALPFAFPSTVNKGLLFFEGCRFAVTSGLFASFAMQNAGSEVYFDDCAMVGTQHGLNLVAGSAFIKNGCNFGSPAVGSLPGSAIVSGSGTYVGIQGGSYFSTGGGEPVLNLGGTAEIRQAKIENKSALPGSPGILVLPTGSASCFDSDISCDGGNFAVDLLGSGNSFDGCRILGIGFGAGNGLRVQAGSGSNRASNCELQAEGVGVNYSVAGGAGLDKNNLTFIGSSQQIVAAGVINTLPNSEEWFVETRIVSPGEAAAKQLTLTRFPLRTAGVPATARLKLSLLGVDQYFGPDYNLVGDGSTVDWTGLGMDVIPVAAGDTMEIGYWASRKI